MQRVDILFHVFLTWTLYGIRCQVHDLAASSQQKEIPVPIDRRLEGTQT
jgi:hypothetical protein